MLVSRRVGCGGEALLVWVATLTGVIGIHSGAGPRGEGGKDGGDSVLGRGREIRISVLIKRLGGKRRTEALSILSLICSVQNTLEL